MIPILYGNAIMHKKQAGDSLETERRNQFDKVVKCEVTESINKEYTATLEISMNDQNADVILPGMYIKVKPNPSDPLQFFRIDTISRDSTKGTITLTCKHLVYNLFAMYSLGAQSYVDNKNYYSARKPSGLFSEFVQDYLVTMIFAYTFTSNDSDFDEQHMYVGAREPVRAEDFFWKKTGSLADLFQGQFKFDNFDIYFYKKRGTSKSIEISYGKNLSKSAQKISMQDLYTSIQPYAQLNQYTDSSATTKRRKWFVGPTYYFPDGTDIDNVGEYRAYLLDITEYCEDITLLWNQVSSNAFQERCNTKSKNYAAQNTLGKIRTEFDVTVQAELKAMQSIYVGDTVRVVLDKNGTITTAQVVAGKYDVINERWNSLTVGKESQTFADYILGTR